MNTKTESLKLLARYSLPPNSLGYCGKNSAVEKFRRCICANECAGIEEEITHFIVLHPYLQTISKITGKELFDYEVAECFWLGNDLINRAQPEHYDILLDFFIKQGVPEGFVSELREKRPVRFLPFHLFQVLHVGVGKSSGSVPFNIDTINNCMIRWGEVINIEGNSVELELHSLKQEKNEYVLYKKRETFIYDSEITTNLSKGNIVTVHWNVVNKILTSREAQTLEYWTRKTLEFVKPD